MQNLEYMAEVRTQSLNIIKGVRSLQYLRIINTYLVTAKLWQKMFIQISIAKPQSITGL